MLIEEQTWELIYIPAGKVKNHLFDTTWFDVGSSLFTDVYLTTHNSINNLTTMIIIPIRDLINEKIKLTEQEK